MRAVALLTLTTWLPAAAAQTVEVTRPEPGLEVHTTYAVDAAGARVREGPYRVLSSAGPALVEGQYVAGRREGDWVFRTREGEAWARGPYAAGLREGAWTLYSGSPAKVSAKGRFAGGEPAKSWKFLDQPGAKGGTVSGVIRTVRGELSAGVTFKGLLLGDAAHGLWRLHWSDGSLLLRGVYDRGVPLGEHTFHLPAGVETFGMASVRHPEDWTAPGHALHPALLGDFDELGRVTLDDPPAPRSSKEALAALQPLPLPEGHPVLREVEESWRAYRAGASPPAWSIEDPLDARVAMRWALGQLLRRDWDSAADVEAARTCVTWLITPYAPRDGLEWDWSGGPLAGERIRAALLRVYGYLWSADHLGPYALLDDALHAHEWSVAGTYAGLHGRTFPVPEWAAGRSGLRASIAAAPVQRDLRAAGGSGTEQALRDALAWLRRHQDERGGWRAERFMEHDPEADRCTGPGESLHDAGVTGLALLALLRGDEAHGGDGFDEGFVRGLAQLVRDRDPDGWLASSRSTKGIYDHAVVTLLLAEVLERHDSSVLRAALEAAVRLLLRARNPYGAWSYDLTPNGRNDTSVTGWVASALVAARHVSVAVDEEALDGARTWLNEMTDPSNGRCGYNTHGGGSSRVEGRNEHYPVEKGEAMTAVALLGRFFMGEDPETSWVMKQHADLLLKRLPKWEPDQRANDMYYWYHGSRAMYAMGGAYWSRWNQAMKPAVLGSQRQDGASKGSWDPVGPWGFAGGRVYSTSMMALTLATYRQPPLRAAR